MCPVNGATHGLGYPYILPVPLLDSDVVDEMPVLRVRVRPRRSATSKGGGEGRGKDCVGDQEFILCGGLEQ